MSEVTPEYPSKAYVNGVAGLVIVEAVIDKDGRIKQARAAEPVAGLDDAAVRAVRQSRFVPTNRNGQLVEVVQYVPVRFGQTPDLWASDWLQVARFYYSRGLPQLAEGALESARARAQRDYDRYGEISGVTGTAGRMATPPTRLMSMAPVYPQEALRAGVSGVVQLQILVDRFGAVGRAVVLKSAPMLDMAALQSVLRWKFSAAQVNGQPVSTSLNTIVTFNRR
jgi:TonB family protein